MKLIMNQHRENLLKLLIFLKLDAKNNSPAVELTRCIERWVAGADVELQ